MNAMSNKQFKGNGVKTAKQKGTMRSMALSPIQNRKFGLNGFQKASSSGFSLMLSLVRRMRGGRSRPMENGRMYTKMRTTATNTSKP